MIPKLAAALSTLTIASSVLALDELLPLVPVDAHEGGHFGTSVALSGEVAVVGAWGDDSNGPASGAVHVFDLQDRRQIWKILPTDGQSHDHFGLSVDVEGDRIAVGARFHGVAGAVYLYDLPSRSLVHKLVPDDLQEPDVFGTEVLLRGSRLYVGAPSDDDAGASAGAVYVFDAVTGSQLQKWTASDADPQDHFGVSLALAGERLLVGSFDGDAGNSAGSAYLLDPGTGQELAKLLPPSVQASDYFGWSVAFAGRRAFVGAPLDFPNDKGQVFAFDADAGALLGKFGAADGAPDQNFGYSLAGSDRSLVIGIPGAEDDEGRVVLVDPETWAEALSFTNPDPTFGGFGIDVDVDGGRVLIGASNFAAGPAGVVWVAYLDGAPAIGEPLCDPAAVNSTGQPASLAASGADEVDLDCLTLSASALPAGQFALLLNGRDQGASNPPGSQGTLCIAGPIGRYLDQVQLTSPSGTAAFALDLAHTPTPAGEIAIGPGETWTFQCWYRDLNPFATSNFTSGVAVTFR